MHARLDRLSPESDPRWGTMSSEQMICHAADHLRVALGDTEVNPRKLALRFGDREVAVSPGLPLDRVGDRSPVEAWGRHPWFGSISGKEWGLVCWRHLDYHLRQFGV